MEISGKIKVIGEHQVFDSGFSKVQLVITSDEQYPSDIPIDFLKDKGDLLQNFNVGDSVKVSINIRGSEYNGKHYVSLNGWKIENMNQPNNQSNSNIPQGNPEQAFDPNPSFNEEEHSDLPF